MNLILASKSPRRKEILENLGVKFQVITLDTDENISETDPESFVQMLSFRKGDAIRQKLLLDGALGEDVVILSCDTVVVSPNGKILGKPQSKNEAREMLLSFSDKAHRVITGIALLSAKRSVTSCETTLVRFDKLDESEVERYISTDDPYDKAGAYAIQGVPSLWISGIEGDYFNVVGLPAKKVSDTLKAAFGFGLSAFIE